MKKHLFGPAELNENQFQRIDPKDLGTDAIFTAYSSIFVHYSTLRWALMTIYVTINTGFVYITLLETQKTGVDKVFLFFFCCAGLLISLLFLVWEWAVDQRLTHFRLVFTQMAKDKRMKGGHGLKIPQSFVLVSLWALYLLGAIFWVILFFRSDLI